MRVLIAEDEVEIARALKLLLEKNRFTVDMVHSGTDAWDYLIHMEYDAVVLDIMMPGMDGMEVLRRARERRINTPVLFLTAKSEVEDRVAGLMAGADDYLPKPFASSEFIARVKALARRSGAYQPQLITVGQTVLDCGRYELAGETDVLRLNKKEYQLMELFMKHPGQVFSTEHLMKQVWELDTEAGPDVVWTYMGFLRRKLKQAGADVEIGRSGEPAMLWRNGNAEKNEMAVYSFRHGCHDGSGGGPSGRRQSVEL